MNQPIRVLYVDDYQLDRELVRDALGIEPGEFQVTETASRADFESALANGEFDLVLSDFNILGFEGLQVLEAVHAKDPNLPVVIVTGTGSEQTAVEAMKGGAADYVIKKPEHIRRLPLAIHAVLEKKRQEDALRDSEERYRSLFEDSPVSLWEEDFSAVKQCVEDLRKQGIADFRSYFKSHPEQAINCLKQIKVVDVNQATMKLYGAKSKTEIMNNLTLILGEYHEGLQEELVNIVEGKTEFEWQGTNYTLSGVQRVVNTRWSAAPGHEDTLDKILLSMIDVTERKQAEEALRESEEKYRVLFEGSTHGILATDVETKRFVDANPSMCRMLGYSAAELLQLGLADLHPKDALDHVISGMETMTREGQSLQAAIPCLRKDGTVFYADIGGATTISHGRRWLVGFFADVTDRKRAEEELYGVNRALRTLSLSNEALVRASDESSLFESVCRILVEQGGYRLAWVGLAEQDDQKTVRPVAQAGYEQEYLETVQITWADTERGRGPTGTAIRTGRPVIANDFSTDSDFTPWREQATKRGFASSIALPFGSENTQPLGAISIYAAEPNAFTAEEVQLLTQLANDLGYGIESLRTRQARRQGQEQLERQLVRLESLRTIDTTIAASLDLRLTLNVLLDQVTTQLKVDAADVLLLNPHSQMLEHAAARGFRTEALKHTRLRLGEGYAGQAALRRSPVRIPALSDAPDGLRRAPLLEAEGFAAYYGMPLIAKGRVKGVLEIFHRSPLEPDREWEEFLDNLAGQAALAIDAAELFTDLQRSNLDLTLAYDATIEGWSRALDLRDKETEGHTQRVTEMAESLARALGVEEETLIHVRRGALLHDIGKMGVPDATLLKPGPLTEEEWGFMRKHPTYAYEMLSPIAYLKPALDIPYCHHEKWDGTGYPRGLKGEEIPLSARAFAIVDVWDALRSDRPYRPGWPEEKVLEHLREQKGKHFDPRVLEAFFQLLKEPKGSSS